MKFLYILLFSILTACVSVNSMPQDAALINFDGDLEGKTGWSKYEDTMFIKGISARTAYQAAKAGLADANFKIKKANFQKLYAIGEHGITNYDWNVVAGVYLREEENGFTFKVIAQGSKDIGFFGDSTDAPWAQNIFEGIRSYLLSESLIIKNNSD